jgi:hypothetical protein
MLAPAMLLRALAVLILAAPFAALQAEDKWLSTDEWSGQIIYEVTDEGSDSNAEWKLAERVTFDLRLNLHANGLMMTWPGKIEPMESLERGRFQAWAFNAADPGASQAWISGDGSTKVGPAGSSVTTERTRSGVTTLVLAAGLQVDLKKKHYGVWVAAPGVLGNSLVKTLEQITVEGSSGSRKTQRWTTGRVAPAEAQTILGLSVRANSTALFVWDQPLPNQVGPLKSSILVPVRGRGKAVGKLTWSLSPGRSPDIGLELEAQGNDNKPWDQWRPKGGADEKTPGSSVTLTARIVGTDTNADKPHYFRIQLTDVSREKGVCLNWPPKPEDDPPLDFSFRKVDNPDSRLLVTERAVWTVSATGPEFQVKLACFDYGAWGEAVAEAELDSGRRLFAHVKGSPSERTLRLPFRDASSKIAKSWNSPGPDDADDDPTPTGDPRAKGDGLTNYEEYRGFFENGGWTDSKGDIKDFFVRDETGGLAQPGIALFETLSKLKVHHLTADEFPSSRVINEFWSEGPHKVDQHGIRIVYDPKLTNEAEAQPVQRFGTPKNFQRVVVGTASSVVQPGSTVSLMANLVAHELFHCCNVWHHGDFQEEGSKTWQQTKGGIMEGNTTISVVDTAGTNIESLITFPLPGNKKEISVGALHGRYSGDTNCVMHYDDGWARFDAADPKKRIQFAGAGSKLGAILCTGKDGTPPNARYGPATYGDCTSQVHVNDGVPPRTR